MYLRHATRRKDGKIHTSWRLVRSVRIGRRVVQQTVAQLGELDAQGRARAKALAQALVGRGTPPDLFTSETAVEAVVPVRLDQVRLERGRRFGDVWLGWTLWRAVQLDTVLERCCQRAELGRSPRTILEELRGIQSPDVVLPTTDEREVRLRCVVRPNRAQALLRPTSPLATATPV